MKKPSIIGGYQNTKNNNEDFAITPYLFGVWQRLEIVSVYGLGICWGYHSAYIGIGFGIPKNFPKFRNHDKPI